MTGVWICACGRRCSVAFTDCAGCGAERSKGLSPLRRWVREQRAIEHAARATSDGYPLRVEDRADAVVRVHVPGWPGVRVAMSEQEADDRAFRAAMLGRIDVVLGIGRTMSETCSCGIEQSRCSGSPQHISLPKTSKGERA